MLIVKKPKNPAAAAKLKAIGDWLTARGIQVFVERVVWATEFKVRRGGAGRDGVWCTASRRGAGLLR